MPIPNRPNPADILKRIWRPDRESAEERYLILETKGYDPQIAFEGSWMPHEPTDDYLARVSIKSLAGYVQGRVESRQHDFSNPVAVDCAWGGGLRFNDW